MMILRHRIIGIVIAGSVFASLWLLQVYIFGIISFLLAPRIVLANISVTAILVLPLTVASRFISRHSLMWAAHGLAIYVFAALIYPFVEGPEFEEYSLYFLVIAFRPALVIAVTVAYAIVLVKSARHRRPQADISQG
jgi:hypothetical protein